MIGLQEADLFRRDFGAGGRTMISLNMPPALGGTMDNVEVEVTVEDDTLSWNKNCKIHSDVCFQLIFKCDTLQ